MNGKASIVHECRIGIVIARRIFCENIVIVKRIFVEEKDFWWAVRLAIIE